MAVVWEFSCEIKDKWRFMLLLGQVLNLLSEPQLKNLWPRLKCSALTTSSALTWCIFFVRNKLNTRKVSSLNSSPSVFWYRGRLNRLSGLMLACLFLSLSLPVSHFCRMFLLSWVSIVHTLSWLPSQGCCWLLGPLIGSSCALAFLACLDLAFAWFCLL